MNIEIFVLNCQFYQIHHFCSIFTFEYYTVAQKHIRQSYSSVNQHFMAYQRKLMSREHMEKMYNLFDHKKVCLLQRKSVKTFSDKIYGLFHLLFDTYAVCIQYMSHQMSQEHKKSRGHTDKMYS